MDIEYHKDDFLRNRGEGDNFSESRQEFRSEIALHHIKHVIMRRNHPLRERIKDVLASNVGCEQYECVGEISHTAEAVMELALVKNLEKQVEYASVSLFYLVKKHDGIWLLPYLVY